MTPIINIDTTVIQSLPLSKRLTKWMCFLQSLCYPIKWLYNNVLTGYMSGTVTGNYSSTGTYSLGQQAIFNYRVWESTVNGNLNNTPNALNSFSPLASYHIGNCVFYNGAYYQCYATPPLTGSPFYLTYWRPLPQAPWILVNNSFIGATERANYNGQYLSLTWALNRYFQTTFRQPPYPAIYGGAGTYSDIYISTYEPPIISFVTYTIEPPTSDVFTDGTGSNAVLTDYVEDTGSTFTFVIHIPAAVYAAINSNPIIANSIVNQLVMPIVPAGIVWRITPY